MAELLPTFNSEEEYNEYFRPQIEQCNKYRNAQGMLEFKDFDEFEQSLIELFEVSGEHARTVIKDEATGHLGMLISDNDDNDDVLNCISIEQRDGVTIYRFGGDIYDG